MTADSPPQNAPARSRGQWQFSLRVVLLCALISSIVFAIVSQFPRQSAFTFLMTVLMIFPLAVVAALRVPLVRLGWIPGDELDREGTAAKQSMTNVLLRPLRLLGLCQRNNGTSLIDGFATAFLSTATLVGLWPAIRVIGLLMALTSVQSISETWEYAVRIVPGVFSNGGYWVQISRWEAWSLGRWWLLFGAIMVAWLMVSFPLNRDHFVRRTFHTLARFLAFTPWLIVLEVAFLIGVWIKSPETVPEPSTGFVVGIFSWNLWRWDCWLDSGWLLRGAIPTFIAGVVYFASVLRWGWVASVIAAVILIPTALMLSVACTVAYQNGLPC